jgi:hypothetical protein
MHKFLVTNIGGDNLILGYSYFKATNPYIDWQAGKLRGVLQLREAHPLSMITEAIRKTTIV